jgi:hypothetical protein
MACDRIGRGAARCAAAAAAISWLAPTTIAQGTERMSVDSAGVQANGRSEFPAISDDGSVVAFESGASNLIANDANPYDDVFVHDRVTGVTELVSVDSSGVQANYLSRHARISANGQVVAFESFAWNLVAGDTNGVSDVFVHDRTTGVTERVSVSSAGVQGTKDSAFPSISADGRFVAFQSAAGNLVAGDTNGRVDIFVHDRTTGVTERVSVSSAGLQATRDCEWPSISGNGQFVTFDTLASTLVSGDTNSAPDVFVRDRTAGTTERVSVDSSGAQGNSSSFSPSISADGQVVAFESAATNLVAGDKNGWDDIFVHDRATGVTERVSVSSTGAEGNLYSAQASIS